VLLRHAKSSWEDPLLDDFDRPLAKRGRKAAKRVGAWLRQHEVRPDLVLCSESVRTRETLELILPSLGCEPAITYERRLYLADADGLLARIQQVADDVRSVLLIGHNPGMQELAVSLTPATARNARRRLAEKFPTTALARFRSGAARWSDLTPDVTKLVSYVRPADLDD